MSKFHGFFLGVVFLKSLAIFLDEILNIVGIKTSRKY